MANNLKLYPGDIIRLDTLTGIGIQEVISADDSSITRKVLRCDWKPAIAGQTGVSPRIGYPDDWVLIEGSRVRRIIDLYED